MADYKILVKDREGNNLGEFEKTRSVKFGKRQNNYGQCTFDVPINDPKASDLIALRVYQVYIYRDGILIWAGEQANRIADLDEKGDGWATITAYTWLEQLNSRYTVAEKDYSYQDGSQIAWDLIDTTQSDGSYGDLGITQGDLPETTWREKSYTNQSVMDAIISLANLIDGFDFEINDSKVFNIYQFQGVDRTNDIILEYGVNLKKVRITEDFSKPSTRAIILGQTATVSDQIRVERDDTPSQITYGLRESLNSQLEVSELTALQSTGDSVNRKYGAPLIKLSSDITRASALTIADFALGDVIRVKIKKGIYNIDASYRISEWQVDYDDNNTETLSLVLSSFYTEEIPMS